MAAILSDLKCKLADQPGESSALRAIKLAMRRDFNERYQNDIIQDLMNKAAFLDSRFKTFPHLSNLQSNITRESISLTLQEVVSIFKELSTDSPPEDIEIVDSCQTETPPAKKKKIHPLRKLLGNNFWGPSSSTTSDNTAEDNVQAELVRYKAEPQPPSCFGS